MRKTRKRYAFNNKYYTLRSESRLIGKSDTYFSSMARQSPHKWALLQKLGSSPSEGYRAFIDNYQYNIIETVKILKEELKNNNTSIHNFNKYLVKNKLIDSGEKSLYNLITYCKKSRVQDVKIEALKKLHRVISNGLPEFLRSLENETQ